MSCRIRILPLIVFTCVAGLLADEHWRVRAGHPNAMTQRLADGIRDVPGVEIAYPVEANAVFAVLPAERLEALAATHAFYVWDPARGVARLMMAWDTPPEAVDALIADIRG